MIASMFKQFYAHVNGWIILIRKLFHEVLIDNGVKQGDVLALTLFLVFFAILLTHASHDCDKGVSPFAV